MRVAPFHFLLDSFRHVFGTEIPPFLAQDDLISYVQHEIAKFNPNAFRITLRNRVIQFEGFFDEVRPQRPRSLLCIPGALLPQLADQFYNSPQCLSFLQMSFHAGRIPALL